MKKFRCPDPAQGGEVLVHILDPLRCAPPDYREVEIILSDGRRFVAVVARDPQQRGGHWWEKPGAVKEIQRGRESFSGREALKETTPVPSMSLLLSRHGSHLFLLRDLRSR